METEFERNFREAGGTLYEAGAAADVLRIVNEIITGFGIRSTGVSRKILERFPVLKNASTGISSGEITDVGSGVPQLGVTTCAGLIANTGSIIISNLSRDEEILSLLTDYHLAVAGKDQLFPDLGEFLKSNDDCNITLITGASRTADIEKTLVEGVHGPLKVFLILFDKL